MMIYNAYLRLYQTYGPQGWWPLTGFKGTNPTKTGAINGYHVGDYSFPKNNKQIFEICLGAILTQNTSWPQVEKSLMKLKKLKCLLPEQLDKLDEINLKAAIRSSGYHNQKARYIKNFITFFNYLKNRIPTRDELLDLKGIGPETADSMLLYAFFQPNFVIDAYTKRIFLKLGFIDEKTKYDAIKKMVEDEFMNEINSQPDLTIAFQEFHALLVEHAKRFYNKKPYGEACFLIKTSK